jgi:hypothetical protein
LFFFKEKVGSSQMRHKERMKQKTEVLCTPCWGTCFCRLLISALIQHMPVITQRFEYSNDPLSR